MSNEEALQKIARAAVAYFNAHGGLRAVENEAKHELLRVIREMLKEDGKR